MNSLLQRVKTKLYDVIGFSTTSYTIEEESKEYDACRFTLNGLKMISRTAKVTPKKIGQFVTFWKRMNEGPIAP